MSTTVEHAPPAGGTSQQLVARIRAGLVGEGEVLPGPYGPRRLTYADYTASGRALDLVEDAVRRHVLPGYANTHSTSSATGRRTTRLREQARAQVHRAVGGGPDDLVIFCGSGSTAGMDKLTRLLGLSGRTGPLHVIDYTEPAVTSRAFVAAATELGHGSAPGCQANADYNGPRQDCGAFYYQSTRSTSDRRPESSSTRCGTGSAAARSLAPHSSAAIPAGPHRCSPNTSDVFGEHGRRRHRPGRRRPSARPGVHA